MLGNFEIFPSGIEAGLCDQRHLIGSCRRKISDDLQTFLPIIQGGFFSLFREFTVQKMYKVFDLFYSKYKPGIFWLGLDPDAYRMGLAVFALASIPQKTASIVQGTCHISSAVLIQPMTVTHTIKLSTVSPLQFNCFPDSNGSYTPGTLHILRFLSRQFAFEYYEYGALRPCEWNPFAQLGERNLPPTPPSG